MPGGKPTWHADLPKSGGHVFDVIEASIYLIDQLKQNCGSRTNSSL
jgi:hypothetical protein